MKWTKLGWVVAGMALVGCAVETADEPTLHEEVAAVDDSLLRNDLSPGQEATVLKLIDDICGDTWCEGDHNFRFDRLECKKGCGGGAGSCRLTFRLFSYDTDVEAGPTYMRSCKTQDYTGFDSLVTTSGTYQSLQWSYYERLTECIAHVESNLPR